MSSLLQLSNNAVGKLSGNTSAIATSISLQTGQGALFPSLTGSQFFPATIVRASDGAIEIVKVTARSSDTLTITRAQEGTAALAFLAGDRVELRLTAGTALNNLEPGTATNLATSKATPVDADELPLVDSAAGNILKKLTFANLKATVFSSLGALINSGTAKATPVDADALAIMDSAASNATKKLALSNLKAYVLAGGTLTGLLKFKDGDPIASAATVNLSTATGNTVHITGTTGISGWTMTTGQVMDVIFDSVLTLSHHATNNNLPGAANITTAANDRARIYYDGTTKWVLSYQRADGTAVVVATQQPSPPVRQTVLSGPVDSNGLPNFGGSTGSTAVTASGTLKATAAAGGDTNYTGSITNPSWTGLSTNGTMYLYLDITSAGVVTTGSTTLAPNYQWGGTYSTTNNQNTFNIQEMTMKAGNGSTASQVYRVFVGEVTVSGGVVTAITWYAIMGRYHSGRFSVSSSTTYSKAHNLGVQPLNYRLLGASSTGAALVPVVLFSTSSAASANVGASIRADTGSGRLSMTIDSVSVCALPNGRDGNNQQASVTMVEMVAIAERGW